mmetsp:Transcript_31649/g.5727  ORF Transcript_31649/g.5727 Transcript_31649/m.5727 type:complete len:145 (+) Transcript_31649:638-1072(+)
MSKFRIVLTQTMSRSNSGNKIFLNTVTINLALDNPILTFKKTHNLPILPFLKVKCINVLRHLAVISDLQNLSNHRDKGSMSLLGEIRTMNNVFHTSRLLRDTKSMHKSSTDTKCTETNGHIATISTTLFHVLIIIATIHLLVIL